MTDLSAIYRAGNNVVTDAYLAGVAEGRSKLEGVRLQRVLDAVAELDRLHQEAKDDAIEHKDSQYDRGRAYGYSKAAQQIRDALAPLSPANAAPERASA